MREVATGSWPGPVFVFRGLKDGAFAAVERLKSTDGSDYRFENVNASSVAAADWDRDGDVDLVVGYISGQLFFLTNESKDGKVAFGDAVPLFANRKMVEASDAGPCLADWDGDGLEDLILGDGEGGVRLFFATRKGDKGLPQLLSEEWLVPQLPQQDRWKPLKAGKAGLLEKPRPGVRAKPCVGDWNGDGKPDLLVGDYLSVEFEARVLTEEEQAKQKELKSKQEAILAKNMELWEAVEKQVYEKMGLKPDTEIQDEREAEYEKLWEEVSAANPEYQKSEKDLEEVMEALGAYEPKRGSRGFVWVYLRK